MLRLKDLPTLRVQPEIELSLTYRGRGYRGIAGDSIASALYANGIRIFSRSLKYHRPRGLYSLDGECSNCLMEVDGVPNVQAEVARLKDGMIVKPQNVVGTPEHDFMSFIDKLDRLLPAGFYYHYFHRPYKIWPFFQNRLRNAAGLGRLKPSFRMKGNFDEIYPSTDVCVIGSGPAGMQASLAAADQGLRVILLEARPWAGGFFDYRSVEYSSGIPLHKRARQLADNIKERENIRFFLNTSMIGFYAGNLISAFQVGKESDPFDERYIEIRAESVVIATGCIERPMIFDHNERPGIMQVNCAHRLVRTYGLLPGKRAVFSVGDDLGLEAAIDLFDLGMNVLCVADSRFDGQAHSLLEGLDKRNIPFLRGWVVSKSHGNKTLKKATLSTIDGMIKRNFTCDILVTSAGLTPAAGPLFLVKAKMSYDHFTNFFLPKELPPKVHVAGRLLGFTDSFSIETSGRLAGFFAAADCGAPVKNHIKHTSEELEYLPCPAQGSKLVQAPGSGRKRFLCFDEDVTVKNIYQTCDMGFEHVELVKRFSTAGLGPSQGNIPGHNLPIIVAQYLQKYGDSSTAILPTTIRPPLVPTFLATYAGKNPDLFKQTPLHETMEKTPGAVFRRVGTWKRVRYFSHDFTCRKEIENVRKNVGMIDVSSLGKFRIFGPEALMALQRVYVGDMSNIPDGKIKYSVMCNEDGCLIDDGVVVKRGDNDYYFTSSTNRADFTVEWIRYHSRHELWDFSMVNLTDAFGAINLAGPRSRDVLGMITDADLSNGSFPYAGYRELKIKGNIPVMAMRLGFVGELSYELHVPASYTRTVWDLLLEAGKSFDIMAFGLEAQNVLRLEKGHVIIGQETEIRTTLHDLGLGFLWHREKSLYKTVGAPALNFTEHQEGRMKLIGFRMKDPSRPPKDGSVIVDTRIRGHVCTARYSFTLGESIGLALVHSELAATGTVLEIFEDNMRKERLYATVVPIPFYDPEGKRLRM
ncbi:MAG: glycine cleavage T protein (aminomethyl transferase) [Bacteroides sp. SM1_62]|nr:MAG: glycine cleavage T protein (aminomethyl transferase) [Bacteroides sp. SM1_62]